jgi:tetratricopeptide (TPR) repeat protein
MLVRDWAARRLRFVWRFILTAFVAALMPNTSILAKPNNAISPTANIAMDANSSAQHRTASIEAEAARVVAGQYAREKAVAVAELEIISAGNSRLENWIGIFGVLITVILAVFGIATFRQAAAAATEAVKKEFSSVRDEIEGIKQTAIAHAAEIADTAEFVQKRKAVLEFVGEQELKIPDSNNLLTSISISDKNKITEVAEIIDEKSQDQWDVDDYKAKIGQIRYVKRAWNETIELADSMLSQYPKDLDALCFANNMKGDAQRELGKYAEALTCYDVAILSYNLVPNQNSLPSYLSALHGKGSCLIYTGEAIQAVKIYQALLPIRIAADGPDSVGTLVTRHMMARSRLASGKLKEAISDFKKVLIDRRRIEGQNSKGAVLTGCWLAQALLQGDELGQADVIFKSLGEVPNGEDWSHRYLALYAFTQGQVLDAQGHHEEATNSLNKADQFYKKTPPENSYYRLRFNEYVKNR